MAYCTTSDMRLGDLQLPQTQGGTAFSLEPYVDRAATDIDIALGQRYATPITSTSTYVLNILKTTNADLASAYLILAQAQGGEDNTPNAYGMFLYNQAQMRLLPFIQGVQSLPGVAPAPGAMRGADAPISIVNEDPFSKLREFEIYVQTPEWFPHRHFNGWQ